MTGTPVVQVAGFTPVLVNTYTAGGLQVLGYTAAGVEISPRGYWEEVPGDENGGEGGPPVELQFMGETTQIELDLTRFDWTVANTIFPRLNPNASIPTTPIAGQPSAAGTLIFSTGAHYRVLLNSPTNPLNFVQCVLQEPYRLNRGTKYTRWRLSFTAYKNAETGVLFNNVTS